MELSVDLRFIIHYGLHIGIPAFIAFAFYKPNFLKAFLLMLSAMLIDIDHLLANPIFDANRCSIGFHPLHSYYAIAFYFVFLGYKKTRIIALGLLAHILVDIIDCSLMNIL